MNSQLEKSKCGFGLQQSQGHKESVPHVHKRTWTLPEPGSMVSSQNPACHFLSCEMLISVMWACKTGTGYPIVCHRMPATVYPGHNPKHQVCAKRKGGDVEHHASWKGMLWVPGWRGQLLLLNIINNKHLNSPVRSKCTTLNLQINEGTMLSAVFHSLDFPPRHPENSNFRWISHCQFQLLQRSSHLSGSLCLLLKALFTTSRYPGPLNCLYS